MSKDKTNQNGITLIALIITIIVMLILVGVSVTVALNGGLFITAKQAVEGTASKRNEELELSSGYIEIDGKKYATYEDYLDNNYIVDWKEGTKPEGWSEKVTAMTYETNTIPLPNGFEISTDKKEDSIEEGLVITDGTNEFVWIPVADSASYTEDSFGPLTGTDSTSTYVWDSQENLNYYYGMKEDGTTPYYNYSDFTYKTDKTNVENSVRTYGGFYVGRYETTIDGNNIGVERGKTILTAATLLKKGTNTTSNDEYHYRWWGLYKAQKDMYATNEAVGSLMISSKQWDKIITFTGYGDAKRGTDTYTSKPDLSGSAYKTDNTKYDVTKNIYDLAGNVTECTLCANLSVRRICRGGYSIVFCSVSFEGIYLPNYSSNPYRKQSGRECKKICVI